VAEAAAPALQAGKGAAADGNATSPEAQDAAVSITTVTVQSAGGGLVELSRRCGNDPPKAKVPTERI
jgi:hypothetical protein